MKKFEQILGSLLVAAVLLATSAPSAVAAPPGPGEFMALCYHNVEDDAPDQKYNGVSTARLIEQFDWLQHEGYKPVSLDDVIAAQEGKKPLPPKAVLLTFDDGYESFYTRVYPVLKAFHYPAVVAVVDEWMKTNGKASPGDTTGSKDTVKYGDEMEPRNFFLTWAQVREMKKSGLIEIASHSDALHYGVLANPQGNTEPDALSSVYDAKTGTYETSDHYAARLDADAARAADTIKKETGEAPRAMIWPYGAYNNLAVTAEGNHGMKITMSLEDGYSKVNSLRNIPRALIRDNPTLGDFSILVRQFDKVQPMRVVQVDLDYVYDPDPDQEARNIDTLISRIYQMQINTVFLQAFSDPTASGVASEVYFPNRYLPVRQDLFNRVAWQLATRADVKIYGWLPVLSYNFPDNIQRVTTWDTKSDQAVQNPKAYKRISPFDPQGRRMIEDMYEDLARHAPIDGLLFHDDAMMSDFEDASPAALDAYKKAGLPGSIADIRANPEMMDRWTSFKTESLIEFTQDLAKHAALYRAPLKTVRNIYAPLMLSPNSEEWFAQNYEKFLQAYDYTAVEAMPDMENIPTGDQKEWLEKLASVAAKQPEGLKRTVFELQSVDWRIKDSKRAIPTEDLGAEMNLLATKGAMNFGYYPDDFIANVPNSSELHKDFSLQTYPYLP